MRPLRCSRRAGFQGRSKWIEVVAAGLEVDALARRVSADQDAQRLGRRVGVEARASASSRGRVGVAPVKAAMRGRRDVEVVEASSRRRSSQRRVASYSVKMTRRRAFQLPPAPCWCGSSRASQRTRASGRSVLPRRSPASRRRARVRRQLRGRRRHGRRAASVAAPLRAAAPLGRRLIGRPRLPASARPRQRTALAASAIARAGAVEARAMDLERAREGRDRGQQPLLKADEGEARLARLGGGRPARARRTHLAIRRRACAASASSGASAGRPCRWIGSISAPGSARRSSRRSDFSRRTMTGSRSRGRDRDAAREALRVKHLEQAGERVGVAVVRRRGQEQPVLEAIGQIAHGPGELAVHRIACAAGRGGVVRLVQDEQRCAAGTRRARRAGPPHRSRPPAACAR